MTTIKIHINKQSKKLKDGTLGLTEQDGNHYVVYIKDSPDSICTLSHEFGHIIQSMFGVDFNDENFPNYIEDRVRDYFRKEEGRR